MGCDRGSNGMLTAFPEPFGYPVQDVELDCWNLGEG